LYQQQQRDLQETELEMNRSRLEASRIAFFLNFNENFSVVGRFCRNSEPLPAYFEVQAAAARQNPELGARRWAHCRWPKQEVRAAWSGFLPSLKLGLLLRHRPRNHFAVNQFDPASQMQVRNLGYAANASLQVPVWNWGAKSQQIEAG